MAFCWFTTRRREVGLGYGWLLRGTYRAARRRRGRGRLPVRHRSRSARSPRSGWRPRASSALVVSIVRAARRRQRPHGGARPPHRTRGGDDRHRSRRAGDRATVGGAEFPPVLDLVPVVVRRDRPGRRGARRRPERRRRCGRRRAAHARRRGVPGRRHRRDAARPLVSRAAGSPAAPAQRARGGGRLGLAGRGRRAPAPDRHDQRVVGCRRRRVERHARLVLGSVRDHARSCSCS